MSITGVVHAKNEEQTLGRALDSLRVVCDELLVVDMQSSDRTASVAELHGARVMRVPDFGYVEPAWALAMRGIETEWALRIDADEVLTATLARRLRTIVDGDEADAVLIGRLNFMFGEEIRNTGWAAENDQHYFLFKPGLLDQGDGTSTPIHTVLQPMADARTLELPTIPELCVWHFNYIDWTHFVEKMNRYTSIEAAAAHERAMPARRRVLLRQLLGQLRWRGLRRHAWEDGYRGFGLVWLMLTYRVLVHLKRRQLATVGDEEAIRLAYDRAAARAAEL